MFGQMSGLVGASRECALSEKLSAGEKNSCLVNKGLRWLVTICEGIVGKVSRKNKWKLSKWHHIPSTDLFVTSQLKRDRE